MTTTPRVHIVLLLAGMLAGLFTASATAQRGDIAARLSPYTGVYVLPSGVHLAVEIQNNDLAVRPLGQEAAETTSDLQHGFNQRADAIMAGLARNDSAPLRAAIASHRRDRAADIERLFTLFAEGHGALKSYRVMGTATRETGRAWTLVHVAFENNDEIIRLSWKDNHLATIQRGAYPAPTFQHVAATRFESTLGGSQITFNLRADGAVESMTVKARHGEVTAYKLDDLTALQ